MTISWVNADGKEGIAENSYEYAMQQHLSQNRLEYSFNQFSEGQQRNFETKLTPDEETQFQGWKQQHAPNDSGFDYDLRGAFLRGFTPSPENGHWPDIFKKPNHETFSDESVYAKDRPDLAGKWIGPNPGVYLPPDIPAYDLDDNFKLPPKHMDQNNPEEWGLENDLHGPGRGTTQEELEISDELQKGFHLLPGEALPVSAPKVIGQEGIEMSYDKFVNYLHDLNIRMNGGKEVKDWTVREHIGDFLDKAMSVMGAGARFPKITGMAERIAKPAIQTPEGKVFEGDNHFTAHTAAGEPENFTEGYTTNLGRYVSRQEGAKIANAQDQLVQKGTEELHSGDLKPGYERVPIREAWPQEKIQKFKDLVAAGKSRKELASEFDMSLSNVIRMGVKLGLDLPIAKTNMGVADYPHMIEAFKKAQAEGVVTRQDMADKLQISEGQVSRLADKLGVNFRQKEWSAESTQKLKDLLKEGKTYSAIAEELGVTRNTIAGKVSRLNKPGSEGTVKAGWPEDPRTEHEKWMEDIARKNNLPNLTLEQRIGGIQSRIRQIEYDRKLIGKPAGEDYPPHAELSSLRKRLRELRQGTVQAGWDGIKDEPLHATSIEYRGKEKNIVTARTKPPTASNDNPQFSREEMNSLIDQMAKLLNKPPSKYDSAADVQAKRKTFKLVEKKSPLDSWPKK